MCFIKIRKLFDYNIVQQFVYILEHDSTHSGEEPIKKQHFYTSNFKTGCLHGI